MSCDGIKHDLIDILIQYNASEGMFVRWCQDCGAVVVDLEVDNRLYPGHYTSMRFPKMTFPNQKDSR